ncbi:MAG: DUF4399 domain-containing protein [Actinomycetota bacterium]|nr:DUF4399 domain-containing protein [Actinomycetota bacterium]
MTGVRRRGLAAILAAVALVVGGCGDDSDDPLDEATETTVSGKAKEEKLTIGSPAPGAAVKGNVLQLELNVTGISLAKADGDTSGRTGHFHVFIDRPPTPVGQVIPREAGIVHSADNPVTLYGLTVAKHELVVVMGDGAHTRLPDFEARTSVTVEGPSVRAKAPATVPANQPIKLDLTAEGVEIAKPDGDRSGTKAHYHVFVDREPTPAGEAIPPKPEDNTILHTADPSIDVGPLAPGEHVLWVVLGDGAHFPFDPPVRDRITVTVTPA